MSFIQKSTFSLAVTSSGAGTAAYSTVYTGLVYAVHVVPVKAGTTDQTVTITAETTTRNIIKICDPSTLGAWYYPRKGVHNSSAAAVATSHLYATVPLANERVRVIAAGSSGTVSRTVAVTIYIG